MDSVNDRLAKWNKAFVAVTALYWLTLFVATHLPIKRLALSATGTGHRVRYDKLAHLLAFGLLAWLLCRAASAWKPCRHRLVVYVFVVIGLYGIVDELTQAFVRCRSTDLYDWLADMAGAAAGIGTFRLGRSF